MKKENKHNVTTIVLMNAKTGEAIEFKHELHTAEYGTKHFWKADKAFFELLKEFSSAESKVLAYVLENIQPTKNEFVGTYKNTAKKLECDVVSVRHAFQKMLNFDILAKASDEKVWMLNPRLLVKGDIYVQARLMSKYDTLLNRPLSNMLITDKDGNDPVFLPREYPTPESLADAKNDFYKVYNSFFKVLSGLSNKEASVLFFLLCAMQSSSNMYIGILEQVAKNVCCSRATVCRAMDALVDKGFAAMGIDSVWYFNPSMVIKGNRNKERALMEKFAEVQKNYIEKRKNLKNKKNLSETPIA